MKTCIAIAIRFEETLIVQEHSTLKYGTFLGLKKRGNCTQLLEKTFREGKGPNHFSFFFPLASSSPIFLAKTFHPSYRLKTILTNQWFSISSRILVAPSPRIDTSLRPPFSLFHSPRSSPCFYNFAPIFLSSETYITFSFSFLTPRQA